MASIDSDKEWLRTNIDNEKIQFYSFGDFTDSLFIGGGGYGEVFKAKLNTLGGMVAYKILYSRNDEDETTKDFVNEVGVVMTTYI